MADSLESGKERKGRASGEVDEAEAEDAVDGEKKVRCQENPEVLGCWRLSFGGGTAH